MYSSWLPMQSAKMRLLIRSRSAKNMKSYNSRNTHWVFALQTLHPNSFTITQHRVSKHFTHHKANSGGTVALDLWSIGHGFNSHWEKSCVVTFGKSFTAMCLSPNSVTWYWSNDGDVLQLGRWLQAWRKVMAAYRWDALKSLVGANLCNLYTGVPVWLGHTTIIQWTLLWQPISGMMTDQTAVSIRPSMSGRLLVQTDGFSWAAVLL